MMTGQRKRQINIKMLNTTLRGKIARKKTQTEMALTFSAQYIQCIPLRHSLFLPLQYKKGLEWKKAADNWSGMHSDEERVHNH